MAAGRVPALLKDRLDICKLLLLTYVFLSCISSVYARIGTAPLQQGGMKRHISETAEELTVGNVILPDPAEISAYLRTNTTLRNVLLPAYPPLQLTKCEVYLVQMKGLFNFYTAEHPGGCAEAPGFAKLPKSAYSERQQFWLFGVRSWLSSWSAVLASLVGFALSAYCYDRFELKKVLGELKQHRDAWLTARQGGCKQVALFVAVHICGSIIGPLICGSGIGCILLLAAAWVISDVLHPVHLPDPATGINPLLFASNTGLNLRRCSVFDSNHFDFLLYDFYIGMPGSLCPQLQAAGAIYPEDEYWLTRYYTAYAFCQLFGFVILCFALTVTLSGLVLLLVAGPCTLVVIAAGCYGSLCKYYKEAGWGNGLSLALEGPKTFPEDVATKCHAV